MTAVLFSSTLIFTLSKDFLRGVEQCAQRGTFLWNIFFCVEQFRGTFFLRGTIPWNIFSAWNILGKLLATRFSVVANGLRLPGPARLSQVTCN
jgi:hypothetical protein